MKLTDHQKKTIEETLLVIQKYREQFAKYSDLIDCNSKFVESIDWLEDAAIKNLELYCGDTFKWVSWFVFENDMGKKGLQCGFGKKKKKIKCLKDLYWFMELEGNV